MYNLSIKEPEPISLEFWKKLTLLFPKEQQKPNLSKQKIETKFHLKEYTIKFSFKFKEQLVFKSNLKIPIASIGIALSYLTLMNLLASFGTRLHISA